MTYLYVTSEFIQFNISYQTCWLLLLECYGLFAIISLINRHKFLWNWAESNFLPVCYIKTKQFSIWDILQTKLNSEYRLKSILELCKLSLIIGSRNLAIEIGLHFFNRRWWIRALVYHIYRVHIIIIAWSVNTRITVRPIEEDNVVSDRIIIKCIYWNIWN